MEQDVAGHEQAKQSGNTIIHVENLNKTYALPHGKLQEFVAITGPSGSGKTTLLSLLGVLDTADSGEIWFDGTAVHHLHGVAAADFRRQKIGFVFQLFYLLPNLTAIENVMLPLLPYRSQLNFHLKQRAEELLESVGLKDRMGHSPARLSGGEQQRVAIARALINSPKVILADEPTGNLDPTTGIKVLTILRDLQNLRHQTLIMVTHDQQIAALADRQIRLEQLS